MNRDFILILGTVAVCFILYKLWQFAHSAQAAFKKLVTALENLGKLSVGVDNMSKLGAQVLIELNLLRSIFAATAGQTEHQQEVSQEDANQNPPRRMAYPSIPMDMFRTSPLVPEEDAKVEDTVIVDSTDEELADLEKLEETRGRGFEAEEA